MRNKVILLTVSVIAIAGSYMVFGQEDMGGMMQKQDKGKGMMQKQGSGMMMDKDKSGVCPVHAMLCKSLIEKHMVPAEGGGVYVLVGNQLMKYNGDLTLERHTDLDVDMQQIQQEMQDIMQDCPMNQQMTRQQSTN